jgi:hypothetical protein
MTTTPAPVRQSVKISVKKARKLVTDKTLLKRTAQAEKNLKRMKDRKIAKSQRRKAEHAINHNIRSIFELSENVERFLVQHGDDKL